MNKKIRSFLFISKCVDRLFHRVSYAWIHSRSLFVQKIFSRDEIFALSEAIFERDARYLPGGPFFEQGLFYWEAEALREILEKARHVVLLGCGAGREILGTHTFNHHIRVDAMDSNQMFIEAAKRQFSQDQKIFLSHESLEAFVNRQVGVVDSCDLIWFGWGVFSHFETMEQSKKCMEVLSCRYPNAKVFVSFFENTPDLNAGRHFFPSAGMIQVFDKDTVRTLFESFGYKVALTKSQPYPHALFVK